MPSWPPLAEAFAEARAGHGRLVTISGEAGLGKSRLLLEFRRTIDPASVTTLIGRCSSYGQATAYMPFVQALRQLLQLEPSQRAQWTDADVAAGISRSAPRPRTLPSLLPPAALGRERYLPCARSDQHRSSARRHPGGVGRSVRRRGEDANRWSLLLEDWHWVDAGSHETLKRLVDLLPGAPSIRADDDPLGAWQRLAARRGPSLADAAAVGRRVRARPCSMPYLRQTMCRPS